MAEEEEVCIGVWREVCWKGALGGQTLTGRGSLLFGPGTLNGSQVAPSIGGETLTCPLEESPAGPGAA